MILQALYEYYQRKRDREEIAPDNFIEKNIDFLIEIDSTGNFQQIISLLEGSGKKQKGKSFYVPSIGSQAVKHSNSGTDANLLWDKSEFVLGTGKKGEMQLNSFIETLKRYYPNPPVDVSSLLTFYEIELSRDKPFSKILNSEYEETLSEGGRFVSFIISGNVKPIFCEKHVEEAVLKYMTPSEVRGCCLITGQQNMEIAETHIPVKGIRGGQVSGVSLVSFNISSFCSWNKKQSLNAPVSRQSANGYTKAIQFMVNSQCNNVFLGDSTILFWTQRKDNVVETAFQSIFADPPKDDPDAGVLKAKGLFQSISSGELHTEDDERYFVLGLSPNAARISVRLWKTGTLKDLAVRFDEYFKDLDIVRSPQDPEALPLSRILRATAFEYKMDNVLPNLAGAVVASVIDGVPLPATLMQQTMRRIRAEQNINRTRAAILKAYFNRLSRSNRKDLKEVTMSLDRGNNNVAYRLGRLFAVLEKIQEEANPGINATIRDRFYASMSSTPAVVFPILMRMKNHHLGNIENPGRKVNFEREIGQILDDISIENMPQNLSLEKQGYFAIGYYHQRQDFFVKKPKETENNDVGGNKNA